MVNLCCLLAEVDIGKHQRHKNQFLKVTRSPEKCSLDDWRLGTLGRTETGAGSAEGSSPKPPDEGLHLMVLAAAERTLDEKTASV